MSMPVVSYPISDYEDLQEAVQLWADRDDQEFINQIPNFIDFAQKEIYRNLRTQMTQKEAYLQIVNGQAYIPTDWLQTDYLLTVDGPVVGRVTSVEEITSDYSTDPDNSLKFMADLNQIKWCRIGTRFMFAPKITANLPVANGDGTYTYDGSEVVLGYFADPSRMKTVDATNYLLTVAPDLMLFMSMKFASDFIQDYSSSQNYNQKAVAILQQLTEQQKDAEFSGSPLVRKQFSSANGNAYQYI